MTSAENRRILHVLTQREPAGAQRVAHQLCQGFRARGIDSDVWFLFRRHPAYEAEGYRDICRSRPGPFGTLLMLVRLTSAMRSWRPDAVIGHTHHANVFSALAGALARVPRRVIVHHMLSEYESPARQRLVGVLRRLRVFTDEVYVSETTRASYGCAAQGRGHVVHNGADFSDELRPWGGDPRSDRRVPLLVSAGRLVEQKDHATAVRAVTAVPDAVLAILGEGHLRADLHQLIAALAVEDRVVLTGNVDPSHVRDALAAADVVLLPSVWETFGMVLLEAMSTGTPMVVSDVAAHREVLGEAALYHPVGDADALARAVNAVLADPDVGAGLAARMSERAGRFNRDAMVDGYLRCLWPETHA